MTCSINQKRSYLQLLSLLLFSLLLLPNILWAGKQEDSKQIYYLQAEIENSNIYKGTDSASLAKKEELKLLLDQFISNYEPNKQYVISLNFYAKDIAKSNPLEGIKLLYQANDICNENQFDTLRAYIVQDLASIYFQNGFSNDAFNLFVESANYFQKIENMPAYAYTLIDIGNLYYRDHQWHLSSNYFHKAELIFNSLNSKKDRSWGLALVYDNLGQVNSKMNNADTALYYFKKGLKIREQDSLISVLYKSYASISSYFLTIGNTDSAIYYNRKAIAVCKHNKLINELAFSYFSYAQTLLFIDSVEALNYLHQAIATSKNHSVGIELRTYLSLIKYYKVNNLDSAIYYGGLLFEFANETNNRHYILVAINKLIDFYNQKGDKPNELRFLRLQTKYFKEDRKKNLYKSELQVEERKWSQERDELHANQVRNELISNFKTLIVALVLFFSFFLVWGRIKLKRTAGQLEKTNGQLQDLIQKKDMIYSIVAHDLRGPVGASLGLIKLMDEDYMDAETFNEVIPTIRKSMQGTYNLLENLLSWAQLNKNEIHLNKENLDLRNAVSTIQHMLEGSATAKNIDISNLVEQNRIAFADHHTVSTILRNLISNAVKFTQQDGQIIIDAEEKETNLLIRVKDSGVGMDMETLSKIFKDNEMVTNTGTDNEKGSGLGLKLCKEFVRMNGGEIWAESTVGEGSIFFFTLPKFKI